VRWWNIIVSRPSLPEVENNQLWSQCWDKKKALTSLPRLRVYSPNAKISKSSVRAGSHHQREAENTLGYLRALGFMIATSVSFFSLARSKCVGCSAIWRLSYIQCEMLVIFDTTPGANERKPGVIAASARRKDFPANANHFMDSGMRRIVRNSVEAGSVNFISGPVAFGLLDDNFVHGLSPGDALPNVSMVLNLDNGSKVGGCHKFTRSPSSRNGKNSLLQEKNFHTQRHTPISVSMI
jgi:hypothetical protein